MVHALFGGSSNQSENTSVKTPRHNAGRPHSGITFAKFNTKIDVETRDKFYAICKNKKIPYTVGLEAALTDYIRQHWGDIIADA